MQLGRWQYQNKLLTCIWNCVIAS